jgi:hypothetical protein
MKAQLKALAVALGALLLADSSASAGEAAQEMTGSQNGRPDFATVGAKIYQFDPVEGARYFYNVYVSVRVECSGSPSSCSTGNQPRTPSPPEPEVAKAQDLARSVKITFLDGGNLSATADYDQIKTLPGVNSLGIFTFTYHFEITPMVHYLSALTAWDLVPSAGASGPMAVAIQTMLVNESAKPGVDVRGRSAN